MQFGFNYSPEVLDPTFSRSAERLGQYSVRRTAATSAMRKPDANRVLLIFCGLVEDALGRNE